MNFMCHITLRNLRKPGTTTRGIPHGWGFGYISCANYFWESMAWLSFAVLTGVPGAFIFWCASSSQMFAWAQKKHERYLADFGSRYPKNRSILVPFLW